MKLSWDWLRGIFTQESVVFIAVVLATNIIFSLIYANAFAPQEFGFVDPIDPWYFSLTTSSTVAYGDFYPRTRNAKVVVMVHQYVFWVGVVGFVSSLRHYMSRKRKCE